MNIDITQAQLLALHALLQTTTIVGAAMRLEPIYGKEETTEHLRQLVKLSGDIKKAVNEPTDDGPKPLSELLGD